MPKILFVWASYTLMSYLILKNINADKVFGAYRVEVHNYTQCKTAGMDKRPMTSNVTWYRLPNGTDALYISATVRRTLGPFGNTNSGGDGKHRKETHFDEIRLRVAKLDPATGQFRAMIVYKMKDICSGLLASEIITMVPELNKNCTVSKGSMAVNVMDFDHLMHQLTGGNFYYGTYESTYELTAIGVGSCMCTKLYAHYNPVSMDPSAGRSCACTPNLRLPCSPDGHPCAETEETILPLGSNFYFSY